MTAAVAIGGAIGAVADIARGSAVSAGPASTPSPRHSPSPSHPSHSAGTGAPGTGSTASATHRASHSTQRPTPSAGG